MKKLLAVIGLGLLLAGCNAQMTLDPAVQQRVLAGVATAADKAQAGLVKICNNYRLADAVFDAIALSGKIPRRYLDAEAQAVAFLDRTCANPPADIQAAYKAALDAYGTALSIKAQFKK